MKNEIIKDNGMVKILNIARGKEIDGNLGKICWPLYGIRNSELQGAGNAFNWPTETEFKTGDVVAPGQDNVMRYAKDGDKVVFLVIWGTDHQDAQLVNTIVDGQKAVSTNCSFAEGVIPTLKAGDVLTGDGKGKLIKDATGNGYFVVVNPEYHSNVYGADVTANSVIIRKK